jgi:hypothetical protein
MKKYYCEKCEKYHHRGKIYNDHLYFKREIIQNQTIYNEDEITINLDDLRPIAKRQLHKLLRKAKSSKNHELYKNEIIKLLKNEKGR